jgi:hypothetical protein
VDTTAAEIVERLVGLQAQVPRDPYISLWSRIRGFDAAELEGMLLQRRAVRMTLMRTTLSTPPGPISAGLSPPRAYLRRGRFAPMT